MYVLLLTTFVYSQVFIIIITNIVLARTPVSHILLQLTHLQSTYTFDYLINTLTLEVTVYCNNNIQNIIITKKVNEYKQIRVNSK